MTQNTESQHDFRYTTLPSLDKRVLRLGVAGNYGLQEADIHLAAERGVNYWIWTPRFKQVTPALQRLLSKDREGHVVSMLGVAYAARMVRHGVEKALRMLSTEYLDCYKLSWLGKGSFYSSSIQDELLRLKESGKIRSIGTSIHDRKRAGQLAIDSIIDTFMIRYNAAHPGAEQDIFPHLERRHPTIISYTTTSWRQLVTPTKGLGELPPWPGTESPPPPPLSGPMCYRFCLSSPHVHVALTAPKTSSQLVENLDALDMGPLGEDEESWIRHYVRRIRAKKRFIYF